MRVTAYAGLTAPYAESLGACALVRGMRPYADADSEIALALMNQKLAPEPADGAAGRQRQERLPVEQLRARDGHAGRDDRARLGLAGGRGSAARALRRTAGIRRTPLDS